MHYCDHALSVRPSVCPSLTFHIFDFSSETAEQNSTKLDRKQELNILYQVCVFRADWKNKMAAIASDWLRHFRLLLWNHCTEFKESWQEATSQLPLPSFCFFLADWKNKMGALASDWLRHFRLLLWNRWMKFKETWLVARSQRPLPSLCFSGWSEKQDGRHCLWLAETFSTSPLKLLKGIQWNLTRSNISMSPTQFLFFGLIGKTRWLPWPRIGWDIFDFSRETAERNSRKLDRKQDLNVLYQVCVFRDDQKNKLAALASYWLRHFRLPLWNRWTEFNETWQEAKSRRPLWSLYFSGGSVNKNGRPGRFLKKVAHCTQEHDMWPFGPLVSALFLSTLDWILEFYIQFPNEMSPAATKEGVEKVAKRLVEKLDRRMDALEVL